MTNEGTAAARDGHPKAASSMRDAYARNKKEGKRKLSIWVSSENHFKLQILKQITGEDLADMAATAIDKLLEKNAHKIAKHAAELAKVS